MNDIQTKQNIYSTAVNAVEQQQKKFADSLNQLTQAKNTYLSNVVHTATLKEKAKRKKDVLYNLLVWGTLSFLALILLIIDVIIGVVFIVAVVVIACIVQQKTSDKKSAAYNNRRSFFIKYEDYIPANERLKWKNWTNSGSGANISNTANVGWTCPECNQSNTNNSNFCISCGTKKL